MEITSSILQQNQFPKQLQVSIYKVPKLFIAGKLPEETYYGLAMVGTRRPGSSAQELCRRLVLALRGTNCAIISGLAQGIDSLCHEAALEAGIPTIAVLAQGLETNIEGSRGALAKQIIQKGGALISQFEPSEVAYKGNFIARNKIIAGLCNGVIVVQSKAKGGALITANFCKKDGKSVFAIPGDFDNEVYSGTNMLLDKGLATPIFCPESLSSILGLPKQNGQSISKLNTVGCHLSEPALQFFSKVNGFRKTFDNLIAETGYTPTQLLAILTELEIAGLAHTEDNFQFYFNGVS